MNIITIIKDSAVATITLSRGKVNALNEEMVDVACAEEALQSEALA